jgi:hypothetical protein
LVEQESELRTALRHVRTGRNCLAQQQNVIATLRHKRPTDRTGEAVLGWLEETQRGFEDHYKKVLSDGFASIELNSLCPPPQANGEPGCWTDRWGIVLNSISVQALAMALHELTTNALKYGALGQKGAHLNISWRVKSESGSPWMFVDWREGGVETAEPTAGQRGAGNGRRLSRTPCPISSGLEQASRSNRTASTARSRFVFPYLRPRRSRMVGSALRDRRILVVEDEYLIGMSLTDALENAGSIVVGPVPSVDKAIKQIESEPHIDAAVVDVNLGGVLAFAVADTLIAKKIPFVFASGYEDNVLNSRYS